MIPPDLEIITEAEMIKLLSEGAYLMHEQFGDCMICNEYQDLRAGACFDCAPQVDGRPIHGKGHQLWDSKNPSNTWVVGA